MEIADIDGNGTIDKEEFWELAQKLDEKMSQETAHSIFDKHGTGDFSAL